jgi:hypothetical protein
MPGKIRLFVALVVSIPLVSLAAPSPHPARAPDAGSAEDNPLVARMSRTACFGTCPIYEVSVYADGTVEYEGHRFVKDEGKRTAKLTQSQLAQVRAAFEKAGFLKLEGDFACYEMTDMPSANVTYRDGDTERTIHHYHGCRSAPETMSVLEKRLDELLGTRRWVGSPEERRR